MWSSVDSSQRQDSILRQFAAVERGHRGRAVAGEETSSTGSSRQQMGPAARQRNALIPHQSRPIQVIFITNFKQVNLLDSSWNFMFSPKELSKALFDTNFKALKLPSDKLWCSIVTLPISALKLSLSDFRLEIIYELSDPSEDSML